MQAADLIGQRFGTITVVEKLGQNRHRCMVWLCKCDCGETTTAQTYGGERCAVADAAITKTGRR